VQVLSRHGSRFPTAHKTEKYRNLIDTIQKKSKSLIGKYAFLENFEFSLGADNLTAFGRREMVDSGVKLFERYPDLSRTNTPFYRAAGSCRVVDSAEQFSIGFKRARAGRSRETPPEISMPDPVLVIPEGHHYNNTLNYGLCKAFRAPPFSLISKNARDTWRDIFVPPIRKRTNRDLGLTLKKKQIIYLMDMCPFQSVSHADGSASDFCDLFTDEEWQAYDYYRSLEKYYGFSHGNPLGPTQGVGWVNELISRMTGRPVIDHTSVNHTLDDSRETFPLGEQGQRMYADFSHDNAITTIQAAMGLYSSTGSPSNTTLATAEAMGGYSASWTVPFASRMYVEKIRCKGQVEESVRVLVNDRIVPLGNCSVDESGLCGLNEFVQGLGFARSGGRWEDCAVR